LNEQAKPIRRVNTNMYGGLEWAS